VRVQVEDEEEVEEIVVEESDYEEEQDHRNKYENGLWALAEFWRAKVKSYGAVFIYLLKRVLKIKKKIIMIESVSEAYLYFHSKF
jgi:hypothetical protein